MIYYEIHEVSSMFFLKKPRNHVAQKEAEIQAIRSDTIDSLDRTGESLDKFNGLFDKGQLGTTGKIFYATGGARRTQK